MALISQPEILFLDEPTLGLDVIARHDLWDTIRGLKGRVTIILTTHYMEEAEALSDRIGIMKNGRLLAMGTAEELKQALAEVKTDGGHVAFYVNSRLCNASFEDEREFMEKSVVQKRDGTPYIEHYGAGVVYPFGKSY